jgi:hypothetical protein
MDERVTSREVTFAYPFSLKGIDGELPPGTYTVEMVEEPIASVSFLAFRRVSTAIVLSRPGRPVETDCNHRSAGHGRSRGTRCVSRRLVPRN